ncbi:MAG: MBL fold metallo-hydrolase [Mesorhizobium sp.]|nr:MBL fold metallo-hydrolase [Mesorhizobium sp.]
MANDIGRAVATAGGGEVLRFPFAEAPATGTVVEVAPGILWTRIPLPFRLDHVNIYLIEDGDGWAVLDTGISNRATREVWEALTAGPLAGRRLTRLIVTHFHPDHIGLAGWLCERHSMPLLTSQTCYLGCINISLSPNAMGDKPYQDFYRSHGMSAETAQLVATQGNGYLHMVSPLPPTFRRLVAGDTLDIGGRPFEVMSADGHAAEQLMFYLAEENVFLASDQVLAKITPNVSVWAVEPDGDPLGLYIRSLGAIEKAIPANALVLPGHQLPFYGLHERARELAGHHADRCERIAYACHQGPRSVAELVPVLFPRPLDPHQLSFAFSETHAHVNYMVGRGELAWEAPSADLMRVRRPG